MDKKTMMENLAREAYEKGCFNGVWLYAENGEIVSKGALGFRDAEDSLPMTEDTIFEMASITKMFTATAVMLLVREGKLGLDDAYVKYFPEYPYPEITLRHLLTHTSGMPDDFNTDRWVEPVLENEHRIPPNSEMLRFIRESGEALACAPGEKFRYTDVGYTLLAEAVEKAAGVPFEAFLKQNIFEPAGMKDSAIYHTRRDGRPSDRFARNMSMDGGKLVPSDLSKYASYVVGSDGLNGCDYLYTTIFDMLAWDRALREEKVLTRAEQALMFTPMKLNSGETFLDEDGEGYGLGWAVADDPAFGPVVYHSGGMPGLSTWFERFVDADRVLVRLCCREALDARGADCFFKGMRAIMRDKEPGSIRCLEDYVVENPDKSGWDAFCGVYDWDGHRIDVHWKEGELFTIFRQGSWVSDEGRLYPLGDKTFGLKDESSELVFGDGCLTFYGEEGKKL